MCWQPYLRVDSNPDLRLNWNPLQCRESFDLFCHFLEHLFSSCLLCLVYSFDSLSLPGTNTCPSIGRKRTQWNTIFRGDADVKTAKSNSSGWTERYDVNAQTTCMYSKAAQVFVRFYLKGLFVPFVDLLAPIGRDMETQHESTRSSIAALLLQHGERLSSADANRFV